MIYIQKIEDKGHSYDEYIFMDYGNKNYKSIY